jgi:hypothetical protein
MSTVPAPINQPGKEVFKCRRCIGRLFYFSCRSAHRTPMSTIPTPTNQPGKSEVFECRRCIGRLFSYQHGRRDGWPGGEGEPEQDGDSQEGGEGVAQVHD